MGVKLDTSEVRGLAGRVTSNSVRLGSKAAALLREVAYDIEADAKVLAPVDTGALEGSISTTIGPPGSVMTAEIGPTVEYGIYQEYGTSTQPGKPFLGPAFDRRAPVFTAGLAQLAAEVI